MFWIARPEKPGRELNGEVVGNEYLRETDRLTPSQLERLSTLGWHQDSDGNLARSWVEWTGPGTDIVVNDLMEAIDVFGIADVRVRVETG